MNILIKLRNEDGDLVETSLPGTYEVCPRCSGKGTHVNPSIDGNGLSEDMEQDPDFRENYFSGAYDIQCLTCHGLRVVHTPDYDRCSDEQKRLLDNHYEWLDEEASYRRTCEAERRFGC